MSKEDNEYIAVPIKEYKNVLEIIDCYIKEISCNIDYKSKNTQNLITILETEIKKQRNIRLSTKCVEGFAERIRIRIDGRIEGLEFAIQKIKEMEENKK